MSLLSLIYLFNIFTCLMTGILLLASKITPELKDPHYHHAKILISSALLLMAMGKSITLLRSTDILPDLFPFIPLVIGSLQACLITFTVLILFHSDYVSRSSIIHCLLPTFIFIILYGVSRFLAPEVRIHNWEEYGRNITNPVIIVRTTFLLTYLIVIVRYIRLFNRERKIYTGRINNYFSDTDLLRSTWGTRLFYEGLTVGLLFAFVCSYPSAIADGIVTMTMAIFYFTFAIRYINYQYKLLIVLPAVKEVLPPTVAVLENLPVPHSLENRLQELLHQQQPYLTQGIVLADLAEKLNIPSRDLSYHINHTYGMNFNTWINTLRIEHAKKLIGQTPRPSFEEIAEQSGFSDKTKFSRIFKQITGFLYRDYINQL